MAYPQYTVEDLAAYTGRPLRSFPKSFIENQALPDAALLFRLGTCLTEFPTDPDLARLARNAILSMADAIHLAQPYQKILASPLLSESIGSYSYSKLQGKVQKGIPTGVGWFDMAVAQLSVCDLGSNSDFAGAGIEVFENDATFIPAQVSGNTRISSPSLEDRWF